MNQKCLKRQISHIRFEIIHFLFEYDYQKKSS